VAADTQFAGADRGMRTEPKLVTAVFRFYGGPDREQEAAGAWAFELTYYFLRGVGEQPAVTYDPAAGVYTVSGLMQTTHPGDRSPVTVFNGDSKPSSLDFCVDPCRMATLREMYPRREPRWDGRG
jgi:hypothetical protein